MFTDIEYYKGDIALPNINKDVDSFYKFVNQYEKAVLISLLGYTLYAEFIDGLSIEPIDPKWLALRDGTIYDVVNGELTYKVKWNGLINSDKVSLLSYFVYYNYLLKNYQQFTGLGATVQTPENATIVSPNEKIVSANNSYYKLASDTSYLSPSLYNFLVAHKVDYPSWVYDEIGWINILGL